MITYEKPFGAVNRELADHHYMSVLLRLLGVPSVGVIYLCHWLITYLRKKENLYALKCLVMQVSIASRFNCSCNWGSMHQNELEGTRIASLDSWSGKLRNSQSLVTEALTIAGSEYDNLQPRTCMQHDFN